MRQGQVWLGKGTLMQEVKSNKYALKEVMYLGICEKK
jgi:hypothetical protein